MTCYVDVAAVPGGAAAFSDALFDLLDFGVCEECGVWLPGSDLLEVQGRRDHVIVENSRVCLSCSNTCDCCSADISIGLGLSISGAAVSNEVCERCFDSLSSCYDCGRIFDLDQSGITVDGEPVCERCRREYFYCCSCDDYVRLESVGVCSDCEHCENCGCDCSPEEEADDTSGLMSWDYKPRPVFIGAGAGRFGALYYGLELEVERADSCRSTSEHVEEVRRHLGDVAYCKHDGSLNSGFEIVTHPMTFDYFCTLDQWDILLARLQSWGCNSWTGHTCGFHVHLSRSAFTLRHLHAFTLFWYRNRGPVRSISGRRDHEIERWARLSAHDGRLAYGEPRLIEKVQGRRSASRYHCVNLENSTTVEVRIFRGSLRPETVRGYVEMCEAVYRFTKDMTAKDILDGGLSWSAFLDFCRVEGFDGVLALAAARGVS